MKYFLVLCVSLFFSSLVLCQDQIVKRNGQVIKAKVIEIGIAEIKYKMNNNDNGPVYVVDKNQVNKIIYEDGRTDNFVTDIKDTANYTGQLRKAIKIDFLAPLLGYSAFSFEKSTGVGKSYELTLGVIGLGKSQQLNYYYDYFTTTKRDQFGFFVAAGYKFNKLPDFLFGRTRFTHVMQGGYVKPVFYVGNYNENRVAFKDNNQYVTEKQNVTFGALQLEFGKQWVFGDKFLIDVYWGIGYGADNKKQNGNDFNPDDNTTAYNYANARLGKSPGFSATFGLKAGLLIK